jgi:predicted branched-subunit amino acid permease
LAEGKSAATVLIAGFLMNLRFLPMSTALAPFFRGVKRLPLVMASHVVSASSFIVPYLQFQKERAASGGTSVADGYANLGFYVGIGATSFAVWVAGTTAGYEIALNFPPGFEEALKFILPGYFAGLLVAEIKGATMPLICLVSVITAIPGAMFNPGWGWLASAAMIALLGWGLEKWLSRASKSF